MSKKANPTSIGLFFAIGLGLGIAALLVFSSRSLFHPQHKDILYFNSSLKGLSAGAPVKFRGVTVGTVVEILIRHNQASNDFAMPVVIKIDKKLAQSKSDELLDIGSQPVLDQLIRNGFRGQLDAESLVTGVLYIGLDILPNAPPPVFHQLKPEYHEIPTVPTDIQQLLANLVQFDVRGISEKLSGLLARLDTSLSQLDVAAINSGVTNLLTSANRFVTTPDLTNALASFSRTFDEAQMLVKHVDGRVDSIADSVTNTLYDAQLAIADVRVGVRNIADLFGPDSALRPDLLQALGELSNAGRAIADLAEFINRHPNSLLLGRKTPKEQP